METERRNRLTKGFNVIELRSVFHRQKSASATLKYHYSNHILRPLTRYRPTLNVNGKRVNPCQLVEVVITLLLAHFNFIILC
jgi:hypothetical protein